MENVTQSSSSAHNIGSDHVNDDCYGGTVVTPRLLQRMRTLRAKHCLWPLVALYTWLDAHAEADSRFTSKQIETAAGWTGKPGAFVRLLRKLRFIDGREGRLRIRWRDGWLYEPEASL